MTFDAGSVYGFKPGGVYPNCTKPGVHGVVSSLSADLISATVSATVSRIYDLTVDDHCATLLVHHRRSHRAVSI